MFELLSLNDVTAKEYEYFYSLLSEPKKKRIDNMRFEKDKRLSVCAEMLAKKMIAKHCSVKAEEIVILTDSSGKPYAKNLDVCFNISHSGDMVGCALSDCPIGIDIEKMRGIDDKLIKYVCTDEELKYVYRDDNLKNQRFFEIWTAKEAYFKCIGSGITELKSITVFDKEIKKHLCTQIKDDYAISVYQQNI